MTAVDIEKMTSNKEGYLIRYIYLQSYSFTLHSGRYFSARGGMYPGGGRNLTLHAYTEIHFRQSNTA